MMQIFYDCPTMQHQEHVNLIKKAITKKGGVWADFGSGDGAFTLALRDLAGENCTIYSIDQDATRLKNQQENFAAMFPKTYITFLNKDFTKPLNIPKLDGIIMANSLHYVKNQVAFLQFVNKTYLKKDGLLLLVEYNIDTGNPWVPHPVSYKKFEELMTKAGFTQTQLLEKIPSTYWDEMYSAMAIKKF